MATVMLPQNWTTPYGTCENSSDDHLGEDDGVSLTALYLSSLPPDESSSLISSAAPHIQSNLTERVNHLRKTHEGSVQHDSIKMNPDDDISEDTSLAALYMMSLPPEQVAELLEGAPSIERDRLSTQLSLLFVKGCCSDLPSEMNGMLAHEVMVHDQKGGRVALQEDCTSNGNDEKYISPLQLDDFNVVGWDDGGRLPPPSVPSDSSSALFGPSALEPPIALAGAVQALEQVSKAAIKVAKLVDASEADSNHPTNISLLDQAKILGSAVSDIKSSLEIYQGAEEDQDQIRKSLHDARSMISNLLPDLREIRSHCNSVSCSGGGGGVTGDAGIPSNTNLSSDQISSSSLDHSQASSSDEVPRYNIRGDKKNEYDEENINIGPLSKGENVSSGPLSKGDSFLGLSRVTPDSPKIIRGETFGTTRFARLRNPPKRASSFAVVGGDALSQRLPHSMSSNSFPLLALQQQSQKQRKEIQAQQKEQEMEQEQVKEQRQEQQKGQPLKPIDRLEASPSSLRSSVSELGLPSSLFPSADRLQQARNLLEMLKQQMKKKEAVQAPQAVPMLPTPPRNQEFAERVPTLHTTVLLSEGMSRKFETQEERTLLDPKEGTLLDHKILLNSFDAGGTPTISDRSNHSEGGSQSVMSEDLDTDTIWKGRFINRSVTAIGMESYNGLHAPPRPGLSDLSAKSSLSSGSLAHQLAQARLMLLELQQQKATRMQLQQQQQY